MLSLAFNQHILHDFLYEDIVASPKIYIPGRTKADIDYWVGQTLVQTRGLQMEMDLVLEYQGKVTIVEAKSKSRFPTNFAVYQLFHPFKYYLQKASQSGIPIQPQDIDACYILKSATGRREEPVQVRFYLYRFDDPDRLDSIRLAKKAEYRLKPR